MPAATMEPCKSADSYILLAADLSLRRPGFAKFRVCPETGSYELLSVCDIDGTKHKGGHGEILNGIYEAITELSLDVNVFVREQGFSRFSKGTQA